MIQRINDQRRRPFIVVSYYTINTGYEKEVENLIASLERFNLDYDIRGIQTRGSWLRNIRYRPEFLAEMLNIHPDRDIVWIDGDGVVQQDPVLLGELTGTKADIAVHFFKKQELLGGTMWLRNGPKTRRLMQLWQAEQRKSQFLKEQLSLQRVLAHHHGEFFVYKLPAQYTQIFDLMKDAGQPVIEHFQASRRFKREVGIDDLLKLKARIHRGV